MKKFTELNNNTESTEIVEKKSFKETVKETGSKIVHNKWVRRVATGAAVAGAAVVGFMLGSRKGEDDFDPDDLDIVDLDEFDPDEYPEDSEEVTTE